MHGITLIGWAFGVGILQGFLHCSGMCGPFVMAFSLSRGAAKEGDKSLGRFLSWFMSGHVVHNLGRVFTFTVIGSIFGLLGTFVNAASRLNGLQALAGFIGGGLMILWAVDEFLTGHGGGFLEKWSLLRFNSVQSLMRKDWSRQPFIAGAILGLHPCGLLFAMLVSAAATGSVWMGGTVMLVFGIGTMPALLVIALLGWYGRKRFTSRKFSYVAAVLIAASGVLFILRGMSVNGWIPEVNPWLF